MSRTSPVSSYVRWAELGPKLKGKLHIWIGEADDDFLNNAVHRLDESLSRARPPYEGWIIYGPGQGHCWMGQLKVHSTATVTLAIKNVAMSYPAADFYGHPWVKQELHPHNMLVDKQAFLVGMLMRFPIDLAIVTGHPAMIGKDPVGGKAVETGIVIAGRNAVSVDSVGAHLLGFETLAIQHIRQAAEFGLGVPLTPIGGESGQGRLKIVGISVEKATEVFRKAAYGEAF